MRLWIFPLLTAVLSLGAFAVEPKVAELSFDARFQKPGALADEKTPDWLTNVEQQGGVFLDEPKAWQVAGTAAEGVGKLILSIDRERMPNNLVATILFDGDEKADIAVQLLDAQNRVVVLDLFGNIVDVGNDVVTDTFVIPLKKYPSAEKIVLRRINGKVSVHGIVLYPVVVEGTPVNEAMQDLARVLGDPLSPENPLVKNLRQVAKNSGVSISPAKAVPATTPSATKVPAVAVKIEPYAAATIIPAGAAAPPAPSAGLVAYWSFDLGNGADSSGNQITGKIQGGAKAADGLFGKALRLRKNPTDDRSIPWDSMTIPANPKLDIGDSVSLCAWIQFDSLAPRWGSQIIWHGDDQFGRDPYVLHLFPDGTLEMRSDRSVTGRPQFTVFEEEIYLTPKGKPQMNQHVGAESPRPLAPKTWYFVTGTIGKISARQHALRLYVNGEIVSEVETDETLNYPTQKMYTTIGGVDLGSWQNFDGLIDEVRIYNRSLSPAEVKQLYQQPRR